MDIKPVFKKTIFVVILCLIFIPLVGYGVVLASQTPSLIEENKELKQQIATMQTTLEIFDANYNQTSMAFSIIPKASRGSGCQYLQEQAVLADTKAGKEKTEKSKQIAGSLFNNYNLLCVR